MKRRRRRRRADGEGGGGEEEGDLRGEVDEEENKVEVRDGRELV
jgi:hypothetical protein